VLTAKDDDGTLDVYFGPDSPGADLENNGIKTNPGEGWFAYFRFYGPLQPYFEDLGARANLSPDRVGTPARDGAPLTTPE
jgi:hypothetical protein